MKNIILSAGFILAGLTAQAQTCEAVATLNEDFSNFTIGTTALPQNCWSAIAAGYPNGVVYADGTENKYAVYYGAGGTGTYSYLIGPEISSFDGSHQLSFTTWKLAQGPTVPAGTVTIQVGTISDSTDAGTFVAFGDAMALSAEGAVTFDEIIIPSAPVGSHIAWRFSTSNQHNAVAIDDVIWNEVPAPACEAVSELNQDFSGFTTGQTATFPQFCWSAIANGPMVYPNATDGNSFAQFYSLFSPNVAAYLVSPELDNFDGGHTLTFNASATGPVVLQPGYLTNPLDAATFTATGDAITLTTATESYSLEYPEFTETAHIAFQFTAPGVHQGAMVDDIVWDTTAGNESLTKNGFNLYPNPANGTVNIAANSNTGTVSIFSTTGNKVFEATLSDNNHNINITALSAGLYIVRYKNENGTATQKLIVR